MLVLPPVTTAFPLTQNAAPAFVPAVSSASAQSVSKEEAVVSESAPKPATEYRTFREQLLALKAAQRATPEVPRGKKSKAGRFGSFILFFVLGLGVAAFIIKSVVIGLIESGAL